MNDAAFKDAVADTFARLLKETLTPEEFTEVRHRNGSPAYGGNICASHDFCDSNLIMQAAFAEHNVEALTAGEQMRAGVVLVWNAAWDAAKQKHLTVSPMFSD